MARVRRSSATAREQALATRQRPRLYHHNGKKGESPNEVDQKIASAEHERVLAHNGIILPQIIWLWHTVYGSVVLYMNEQLSIAEEALAQEKRRVQDAMKEAALIPCVRKRWSEPKLLILTT